MKKKMGLGALGLMILSLASAPQAQAAVSAPTKAVHSKDLAAPEISSDTRNLEAILEKESPAAGTPSPAADTQQADMPAPEPEQPAQTILVMPSAAAPLSVTAPIPPGQMSPSASAPEPVQPAQEAPPVIAPQVTPQASEPPPVAAGSEPASGTGGWPQWTSEPASVFTAIIAFFMFLLALAGGYYVYMANATARRQLRAYVFVTQTEINGVAAQTQPVAQLAIRNTGQTPAQDMVVYGNMVFEEFPLKKDLPVLVFSDPQLTKENLGPGSERYKWEYALTPLTEEQTNQMQAGTHALYVYGEIRYVDVFKKTRSTKYLYYTGGNMGIRGTILGGYPQGNEAS